MAKILDFFRRRYADKPTGRIFEDIVVDIRPHSIPALMLRKSEGSPKSYLGGNPYLPSYVEWPAKEGNRLTFLASLDLEEIAETGAISWLPTSGKLLFFYDVENQPWGFDPADRGGWSVVYVKEISSDGDAQGPILPHQLFVDLEKVQSLPGWERLGEFGIELDDADIDTYIDGSLEWCGDGEQHHIGGYPTPVQGDQMELECQLAANGIYCGDGSAYQSEEAKSLEPGAKDWRLLLQLCSDDDLDVMWGDAGDLYFWVREQDSLKGDFSNVWLVLQCS